MPLVQLLAIQQRGGKGERRKRTNLNAACAAVSNPTEKNKKIRRERG
jgi:hypothetical protein